MYNELLKSIMSIDSNTIPFGNHIFQLHNLFDHVIFTACLECLNVLVAYR